MNVFQSRPWRMGLLLAASGCAGTLDNAEDYQSVPVRDTGPVRTPAAGRPASPAQVAGAAGGKWASAGQGAGGGGAAGRSSPVAGRDAGTNTPMSGPNEIEDEDAGAPQMPNEPVACDFRALMQAKCGNATCHGGPGSATGLDLTSAMLAARVEDRNGKGACSDKLLVDHDNPRESKLYLKVSGTTCGSQMPLGGTLSATEQACVLTWIEQL